MAFLSAAAELPAQTIIYRQVDAAGHITYTDRPGTAPSPRTVPDPASDVAVALASSSVIASRRGALIDVNEAARRLRQAQQERKQGAERLPDEQAGGNGLGAAIHRYWQRQERLRLVVEQAQRRLSETGQLLRAHP